jgi:hypothetical protein
MLLDASDEDGADGGTAALSEGPEQQATAHLTGGVLHQGQTQAFGLGPEVWDVAEILGVGGDLLEQPLGGFDGGEVLLALVFSPSLADQSVLAPDALDGHVRDRQLEFAFQGAAPKVGNCRDRARACCSISTEVFWGGVVRGAAVLAQARRPVLLVASPPFAQGEGAGEKESGGGLDAPLSDGLDQAQAVVVGASHLTNHIEVRGAAIGPPFKRRTPKAKHPSNALRRFGLRHFNTDRG